MRKIKVCWISSFWEIHLFSCISAWDNTLFLMREFTRNSVSPHAGIHWTSWKSTQRNYTFSGALPQVEIHNNKSISSYAETYILVNFLILENSHFLVYIRMRYDSFRHCLIHALELLTEFVCSNILLYHQTIVLATETSPKWHRCFTKNIWRLQFVKKFKIASSSDHWLPIMFIFC